jgi:hypothetical protein
VSVFAQIVQDLSTLEGEGFLIQHAWFRSFRSAVVFGKGVP